MTFGNSKFLDYSEFKKYRLPTRGLPEAAFPLEASCTLENGHLITVIFYRLYTNGTFEIVTLTPPGSYDYFPNNKVDVSYVRTIKNGLCYKLELESPVSFIQIIVSSSNLQGIDKLTKVNMMIAAKNTWQGIILNDWPYNQVPLKIVKDMVPGFSSIYNIKLKEESWKNLEGHDEFDNCIMELDFEQGCISMFEPQTHQNENRYEY